MKIVYTMEGCNACHKAIEELKQKGEEVEVRDAEKLIRGEKQDHHDVDAMAELQWNDQALPVILTV